MSPPPLQGRGEKEKCLPRITPLTAPYPESMVATLDRLTPEGGEAPMIFRIVGTSERALKKFFDGALLDKGPLPMRERELVIFRTAAQIGADYEWGMHAALYAERCDIGEDELNALAKRSPDEGGWSEANAAMLAAVDELVETRHLTDESFARLSDYFTSDQIMEIVQLVGFYNAVAIIVGAFDISPEPGTPPIPR